MDSTAFRLRRMPFLVFFLILFVPDGSSLPAEVTIGGLFGTLETGPKLAFQLAVAEINERKIFPDTTLIAAPTIVPEFDRFFTEVEVCKLMGNGVAAIFGPSSSSTAGHIQSVCDAMEIPHIESVVDSVRRGVTCSVNLFPSNDAMCHFIVDAMEAKGWKAFTILYEDLEGLQRLSSLLQMLVTKGYSFSFKQLSDNGNYRVLMKSILNSGAKHIVIDCSAPTLEVVLRHALQVGVMAPGYNYIVTSLDMHTIDLEPFQYAGAIISGARVVVPEDPLVVQFARGLAALAASEGLSEDESEEITPESIRLDTALVYDAVHLMARALERLDDTQNVEIPQLDCNVTSSWEHGCSLTNFMRTTEMTGLSGPVKLATDGLRSEFVLDLIELQETGLQSVGTWTYLDGFNLTADAVSLPEVRKREFNGSLHNVTFTVSISLTDPYGMLKDSSSRLTGNDRYEGYCIDLIKELSLMLGFKYIFILQENNEYGSLNKVTKQWTGMMKEVIEGRVDLAITDLTITRDREAYVDFTMPFMNLGIALIYKVPTTMPPKLFSFLSPYTIEVWMYLFISYCAISLLLFVQARMTSEEWNNPYPCIEEPEELENQFSLNNAFWFSTGSILQQGSEIAPLALPTRMTAVVWYIFTLIIGQTYTANLASFLTVDSKWSPINSVEDLVHQDVIKYGAKLNGSTMNFFKDSEDPLYQQMWEKMSSDPSVFTRDNYEGLRRVQTSEYAFFMESTTIEYLTERHCDITQVGGLLDAKSYGIAMQKMFLHFTNHPFGLAQITSEYIFFTDQSLQDHHKPSWNGTEMLEHDKTTNINSVISRRVFKFGNLNWTDSPYRHPLSAGVLKLAETGRLQELKRRWWKQRKGGGACEETASSGSKELGLDNVGGVFLVLVVGLALACIVAFCELVCHNYHKARKEKLSFKEEMVQDLKFISRCHGSTKPVRKSEGSEESTIPEEAEDGEAQYSSASVIRRNMSLEQPSYQGPRLSGNRRRSWRGSRKSSVVSRSKRSASVDSN